MIFSPFQNTFITFQRQKITFVLQSSCSEMFEKISMKTFEMDACFCRLLADNRSILTRNFSLVARYSLKFTRCSFFVVKSLITRCKIRLLLVAEAARCKKSLATRCKVLSLLLAEVACCKNSLVAKFTRYQLQKLLFVKNRSLLVANSVVTYCINLNEFESIY